MIADSSLSSAFDDLADLFLGGGMDGSTPPPPSGTSAAHADASDGHVTVAASHACKPLLVEGLVLGHLPMLASLWASQYPRMVAATDNAPVALVRLDAGAARVELFHPPHATPGPSRLAKQAAGNGHSTRQHALPDRPCPDLAGAISRAAQVASRIVIYSSFPADELLFTRSATISAMAVLTGADDASAVGAYKAIKRLAGNDHGAKAGDRTRMIRVAVMGSEEGKASAAFHRLADAAGSFLSIPIELAGHCRQIAGGVPGTILFEGPSAMTTQAVLEALARPERHGAASMSEPVRSHVAVLPPSPKPAADLPVVDDTNLLADVPAPQVPAVTAPTASHSGEAAAIGLPSAPSSSPMPPAHTPAPSAASSTPVGLTPLPIRCPFDRTPVLAIDGAGVPQVIASGDAGRSAEAIQQLLSVAAWFWTSRELLGMVCPMLRTDARPVLHLITDRPTDVKRLIDSELRLHVRIPPVVESGTLALN